MKFIDDLDLAKAFQHVISDCNDDPFPDIVGYRDYKKYSGQNLEELRIQLQNEAEFTIKLPQCLDIPKRGFTLRPGMVPVINDRIVYQAIADYLIQYYTPETSVYSYQWAGKASNQMFTAGVKSWLSFQKKVEEYCSKYPHVVETDLTAYFEHINHVVMVSRINNIFKDNVDPEILKTITNILGKMWKKWNYGCIKFYGIPQINDASSFMSNLYLDELDKWMVLQKHAYVRYVDDIRLFVESEAEARRVLADLIVKLREMGLYVSSGKTKIKKSTEVVDILTKDRDTIATIEDEINSRDPVRMNTVAYVVRDYLLSLVNKPSDFNDRLFRFCINRLKRLYVSGSGLDIQESVISEVLKRLNTNPESTDVYVDYLSLFRDNDFVQKQILDFLESPFNIYSWQEMLLIELLVRMNLSQDNRIRALQYANSVIKDNKHTICKAKAYLLIGKNGTYAEWKEIRSHYYKEEQEYIKRTIIIAIQEMKTDERDNFYKDIADESTRIKQIVNYAQAFLKPTYDYYHPPQSFDLESPGFDSDDLSDLGNEYFA